MLEKFVANGWVISGVELPEHRQLLPHEAKKRAIFYRRKAIRSGTGEKN
jgi:hypothetical protein